MWNTKFVQLDSIRISYGKKTMAYKAMIYLQEIIKRKNYEYEKNISLCFMHNAAYR